MPGVALIVPVRSASAAGLKPTNPCMATRCPVSLVSSTVRARRSPAAVAARKLAECPRCTSRCTGGQQLPPAYSSKMRVPSPPMVRIAGIGSVAMPGRIRWPQLKAGSTSKSVVKSLTLSRALRAAARSAGARCRPLCGHRDRTSGPSDRLLHPAYRRSRRASSPGGRDRSRRPVHAPNPWRRRHADHSQGGRAIVIRTWLPQVQHASSDNQLAARLSG